MKKLFKITLLSLLSLTVSGCICTQGVLHQAHVQDQTNDQGKVDETVEHPAWLFLVPPAALVDLATGPIQVVVLLCTYHKGC